MKQYGRSAETAAGSRQGNIFRAGNQITGNDGKIWLIDPAVYYGHPEADLAMTELFGGFSEQFYKAYGEIMGLDPGYRDRSV